MKDAKFFTRPAHDWQRRYEALRASFVERLPARAVGEITECLSEDGHEISVRTIERVLREEGFPKLPRRTRLKMKITVKGAQVPEKSKKITLRDINGQKIHSANAGLFLFAPFVGQLNFDKVKN